MAIATSSTLAYARASSAQGASEKALAEALFEDGTRLMGTGDVALACEKFAGSQAAEAKLGTLLHLADCHRRLGRTASAWAEFNEVAAKARATQQAARGKLAEQQAADLDKKLSRVTITLESDAEGLDVKLDRIPLPRAALGTPLPLDPGPHTLEVAAPGMKPSATPFEVGVGPSSVTLQIPKLEPLIPPAPPAVATPAAAASPDAAVSADPGRARRIAGYVAGASGIVSIVIGSYFGIETFHDKSEANATCRGGVCPPSGFTANTSAHSAATASTVAFGVGLGLVAAGAILYLTAHSPSGSSPTAALVPSFGDSRPGAAVVGTF